MRHDHPAATELSAVFLTVDSPLGPLTLGEAEGRLVTLGFGAADGEGRAASPLLSEAAAQLAAYFDRRLTRFDLPLGPRGAGFQRRVWRALTEIPYGATATYGQLARQLGANKPGADVLAVGARAVGQACGANPIPIIIPCHRVLASSGSGGFSAPGGLDTKYKLLCLEGAALL